MFAAPVAAPPGRGGVNELREILEANRLRRQAGVYSVCSAHAVAVRAAMRQAALDDTLVLIEATANQVSQYGGYTGMRPADFRARSEEIAHETGIDQSRLLLGGDHLGPCCWTGESAHSAMAKARDLVSEYVGAGFKKIHLDTSMPCADDPAQLDDATIAGRAAELCRVAERTATHQYGASDVLYVIGTEVPAPGGAVVGASAPRVTDTTSVRRTVDVHQSAFHRHGLDQAWERVIALVVEPGLEFNNDSVSDYEPHKTTHLSALAEKIPNLVFEAHSTDYQAAEAYRALIRGHFAILKVGPQLTHAYRTALFALSRVESELVPERERADLPNTCEAAMLADPAHWHRHCRGDGNAGRIARCFGFCDRIRYYWSTPRVVQAVAKLMRNLSRRDIPLPLIEQYLPLQYRRIRSGRLDRDPENLVLDQVMRVTERYSRACLGVGSPIGPQEDIDGDDAESSRH